MSDQPENRAGDDPALAQHLSAQPGKTPAATEYVVRFTRCGGLRGWFRAKLKRLAIYGSGSVEIRAMEIVLQGWQRTWLGVPLQAELFIPADSIRNVSREGNRIRFESKRRGRLRRNFEFEAESAEQAQQVFNHLPTFQTAKFARQRSELHDFNLRLRATSPRVWVTPAILAANIVVFTVMALTEKRLGAFDLQQLMKWGGNFGPLTVDGQWWRLVSALFVHFNLLHLLLNMWALWNAGRLAERLYGSRVFLILYGGSGVFASLSSIAWDPSHCSVGASGAVFGILGAFLAFLANRNTEMPAAIVRAHWVSTLAFVSFNLINGALQPGIDNAAHVGGLLSGFTLGWILARPLDVERRQNFPVKQSLSAMTLAAASMCAALWWVHGIGSQLTIPEQYFRAHEWYLRGEAPNLRLWQDLAARLGSGSISDADMARRFERDILPFWKMADDRLRKESKSSQAAQQAYAALVAKFVRLRLEWARALIDATKDGDKERVQDALRLMEETDLVQARIERASMRARMDHRPRALATSMPVEKLRALLSVGQWKCITAPASITPRPAATDSRSDGPAAREAAGCQAQRLFMSGHYVALDTLMKRATNFPGDLPDGGSTITALYAGLNDLFQYGGLQVEQALGRTADWRRAVQGSLEPDLVEILLFQEWAWAARGGGTRDTVSGQAWALFAHRNEMAAAGLQETAERAVGSPVWYQMSMDTALDQSLEKKKLRELFDQGNAKFPQYWPLYRSMLRALMPRWGGSHQEVDEFINEMSDGSGSGLGYEKYSRLYWMYSDLERGDIDIFDEGLADWRIMKYGLEDMVERYPKSDLILNVFANFACRSGDEYQYQRIRALLTKRLSTIAWWGKFTLETCDEKFSETTTTSSGPGDTADRLAEAIEAGARAYDTRNWDLMRSIARKLIAASPDEAEGYLMAGSAEMGDGQYEAAKSVFRKVLTLKPDNTHAWYALGEANMRSKDNREAIDAFNHAIQLEPAFWPAWADRAVVRDALGQRKAALEDAQTACRNDFEFGCELVRDLKESP